MKTSFNDIKRIICPFDFSSTARTGLEYAGGLAQALNASLTVFYVQPSQGPEPAQLYTDQNDINKGIKRRLHVETEAIETMWGITCNIAIESTSDIPEYAIGEVSASYDLIVMGTNGADELYEHVFGTDTHHILGLAKCPVLMVPDGHSARVPKLIVYAFDPETNPSYLLEDLEGLASPLGAEVRSLYVVPEPGLAKSREPGFSEAMIGVHDKWGFDWNFEPICSDDIVPAIDEYMKVNPGALLALSCHHRKLFEEIFQENVIGELTRKARYPVLVFWH